MGFVPRSYLRTLAPVNLWLEFLQHMLDFPVTSVDGSTAGRGWPPYLGAQNVADIEPFDGVALARSGRTLFIAPAIGAIGDDPAWWIMSYPEMKPLARLCGVLEAHEFSRTVEAMIGAGGGR